MKILALESSTMRGSAAWLNGEVDLVREWPNDRKHSGLFFENLVEMQKQFGLPETIIVGLGPGSYAGTRIAISAAIGLRASGGTGSLRRRSGFGAQEAVPSVKATGRHGGRPSTSVCVQLIGYPSICAVETEENEYCIIGDARRNAFFFARIRTNDLVEGPTLLSEAELKEKLDKLEDKMPIFSSEPLPQFERAAVRYPSAQVLARLAQDPKRSFSLPPLEPMYLREPHITVPRSATTP